MARKNKWEDIANIYRERIQSGELKQGEDFPTNVEIMREFEVHLGTVQQVVNALIQEGLVLSHGSGTQKRKVRNLIDRSIRNDGFLTDPKERGHQTLLDLQLIENSNELPEKLSTLMTPPVLYFKTLQFRDDLPIEISCCYLPSIFPLNILKDLLQNPNYEYYSFMKTFGFEPINCQESLMVDKATQNECELFLIGSNNNFPVVRITRKVYDAEGTILEYRTLTDRADVYNFIYNFTLNYS